MISVTPHGRRSQRACHASYGGARDDGASPGCGNNVLPCRDGGPTHRECHRRSNRGDRLKKKIAIAVVLEPAVFLLTSPGLFIKMPEEEAAEAAAASENRPEEAAETDEAVPSGESYHLVNNSCVT